MPQDTLINPTPYNPNGFTSTVYYFSPIKQDDFSDSHFWENNYHKEFSGPISFGIIEKDVSGFARNWGGAANETGRWIHNRFFRSAAEAMEHLGPLGVYGNTADHISLVKILRGAKFAKGENAAGKGQQIYIHSEDIKEKLIFDEQTKSL